jgi:1-acyl-sn-glycerol-3-phosphate acyltransferase
MRIDAVLVNALIRGIFRLLCRMDIGAMKAIPRAGPALIVMNHISFLEAPLIACFAASPSLAALSKKENLSSPLYWYFARLWNAIPIDRGGVDTESFKRCLAWIDKGGVLGLAPEGTRSRDGVLQRGKAGVAMLAQKAGVPVWPVAHWGAENFSSMLKRFRRPAIHVRVGAPYMIEPAGSMTKTVRQEVADDIMASIAALMPPAYRGPYGDSAERQARHLKPWSPSGARPRTD